MIMRSLFSIPTIALLTILGTTSVPALASAPRPSPTSPASDPFELMLRSIDVVPPDRASLEKTFPDAWVKLDAAARDEARDTWTRIRAISMLSYFPEGRTRATLEAVSQSKDPEIRRQAVYTLGRAFGATADAALVRFVASFAKDSVPAVREHAIRSLRWVDAAEAETTLRDLTKQGAPELRKLAQVTLEKRLERMKSPRRGH
jgi:HEAT repeat protein